MIENVDSNWGGQYLRYDDGNVVCSVNLDAGVSMETASRILEQEVEQALSRPMRSSDDYFMYRGRIRYIQDHLCPRENASVDFKRRYNKLSTMIDCLRSDGSQSELQSYVMAVETEEQLQTALNSTQTDEEVENYIDYLIENILTLQFEPFTFGNLPVVKATTTTNQNQANLPDKRSTLIAPIGLELTYHTPIKKQESTWERISISAADCLASAPLPTIHKLRTPENYRDLLIKLLSNEHMLDGYGARVYKDCGDVIEVCTPIHKSRKSMEDWFKKTDSIARSAGLRPWKRKMGGGGMHINISYNKSLKNWKLAYLNFFIMIANHPEINWVFNEPSDNHTANSIVMDSTFTDMIESLKKSEPDALEIWDRCHSLGTKGFAINMKDEYHFEIRTFEMPRSSTELKDMVDFVNELLKFCANLASHGKMIPFDVEVPEFYMDEALERGYLKHDSDDMIFYFAGLMKTGTFHFNRLLKTIGLEPKRYEKYIRRNFYTRRKVYGKKYML